ncbi:MAG: nitrilase-related carbon-nitrogen hydrolase [Geminicoccaceae bacterium]|nr:nitrilase [Geminicoccaceae bacterium]MDW8123288.1 nitrilase-related carbon-nitrogen hydrolase [Geminicoccaceae bacterium]MDW8340411.1 nitrilase-related carbon-nitrogen hydrolase [Geminicoccaceae bacterium]
MDRVTLALWATNMAFRLAGRDAFLALVRAQMSRARALGADIVVMPEHLGELWLQWAPPGLPESEEIPWIAREAEILVPPLLDTAERLGLVCLAGSFPAREGAGYRNRAVLRLPDGRTLYQDKLALTPDERDPAAWMLEPGEELRVFRWNGIRIAVLVCLDVEQPDLAARLARDPPDLVLVPTDTARLSGYHRVVACARARAVELCCAVAVAGGVGTVPVPPERPNVSGAGLYVPCETDLGSTGVWAETGPLAHTSGPGPLLLARAVPLGALRRLRAGAAEVWPGWRRCAPGRFALREYERSDEPIEHQPAQETIG